MPQLRSLELGPCLLSTPAAVSQLTACCSNLATLRVSSWPQVVDDPPAEPTDLPAVGPLRGLQTLPALQNLTLEYVHLPASTLQELGALTHLRSLSVTSGTTSTACFAALMHLTSCKHLRELDLKLHIENGGMLEVDMEKWRDWRARTTVSCGGTHTTLSLQLMINCKQCPAIQSHRLQGTCFFAHEDVSLGWSYLHCRLLTEGHQALPQMHLCCVSKQHGCLLVPSNLCLCEHPFFHGCDNMSAVLLYECSRCN